MNELRTSSAADLGRAIEVGTVNPVDLAEHMLAAIVDHPAGDRIYARTMPERARAGARDAEARAKAGLRRSPLDGVPISWKDLFDTAGTRTEAGSALLAGRVPAIDAEVLRRADFAGLVCLGKTHMTELAFSGLGLNPVTASPPCVNDLEAVSGGSSSGAATSVAFGLAAAGIGSDTGGSVRIPAAWNDLVGFKTASGDLPLTGVVPLCARFDTVGPLCWTVEDAALLYAVMSNTPAVDLRATTLKGVRLLSLRTVAQQDVREAPARGYAQAVDAFKAAGAEVVEGDIPAVADAIALSGSLFAPEAYGTWKDIIEANPDVMFAEVRARFRQGADVGAADFVKAWQTLEQLRGQFRDASASFDAVILPTSPILPPNLERLQQDSAYFVTENLLALRNTRIGNLMGCAALTLPTGVPSTGISIMVQPGQEGRLLRIGTAAEAALK